MISFFRHHLSNSLFIYFCPIIKIIIQVTGQLEIQAEVVLCFMQLVLTFYYFVLVDITRIMVTIKKRAGVIPYSFSSSIALLSSLLSCSFYLLDLRTISSVDILEMT